MAVLMEGQRPGEGGRSLPGLVRRGTGRLPDCGVISRRYCRDVRRNGAFQGTVPLQIGNVPVRLSSPTGAEVFVDGTNAPRYCFGP